MNHVVHYSLVLLLLACSCQGGSKTGKGIQPLTATYSLFTFNRSGVSTLLLTDDLTSGRLSVAVDGIALDTDRLDRSIIVKDGHYYHVDEANGRFVKYALTRSGLRPLGTIAMVGKHIENVYWADDRTLVLFTLDNRTYSELEYHIIDMEDFRSLDRGVVDLPKAIGEYKWLSVGFSVLRERTMIIGYCYGKFTGNTEYTTIDTMYTATLSYPNMEVQAIHKDARSAYPGGINTVQRYGFTDEAGDYYFMSCPGIALGNTPSKPTAIFRIRADSDRVDPDFWINISERIGNDAYGLWYLGDDRAVIRNERKDRYTDFSDHHNTYQFEYRVVDLSTGTLTKLDLPFDWGTRKESVLVKDGTAYIAIDDATDTHRIWCYDIQSGRVSPGLTIEDGADYIVRLERQ